jgi:glucose/mannose-6-phosphate isomerase
MKNRDEMNIKAIDKSNMYSVLLDFPAQVMEALEIGEKAKPMATATDFLILGMGGSAIGGDILATYFANTHGLEHISINVNRDYQIPGYIDNKTAVIASSYSGGTEETIAALKSSAEKTSNITCITSGGKLSEIAEKLNYNKIIIPGGLMPRCALGYSFFALLKLLLKSANIADETLFAVNKEIEATVNLLKEKSNVYSLPDESNPAFAIARKLHNTIPIVYSSNRLNSVNARWRAQIQENGKNLCFGNILPEMSHNEINSWSHPEQFLGNFFVILLRENGDNDRIVARFDAIAKILSGITAGIINVRSDGEFYLSRIFDLIYLADWVSYFLAIFNEEDPTPIPLITKLKELLL